MNKRIKKLWVSALRSGKYKQGQEQTKDQTRYCCLGVLCDLYAKEKGLTWRDDRVSDGGDRMKCGKAVIEWAKLPNGNPVVKGLLLTRWNDVEMATFSQIADLIEANL